MDATWVELWGLTITTPVTAGTNFLLALLCAFCARRLRGESAARRIWWGRFYVAMAFATLAGVLKHGFAHLLGGGVYSGVLWTSSLASGVAVYFAQRATIASRAALRSRRLLEHAAAVQAALFVAVGTVQGPGMPPLIAHTAVGLSPVIAAEAAAWRSGDGGGRRVAAGLIVSMLTGLVYGFEVSPGRWFNHVDLAHVLMGVSFYLIFAGVSDARPTQVPAVGEVSGRSATALLGA